MSQDPLKRIPTEEQIWKIKDKFDACKYFYNGIFLTRKNLLPLIGQGRISNKDASKKVQDIIDTFYTCMTDNKFNGVSGLPQQSKTQLNIVKKQVISNLIPQSLCEYNIDKLYRDLFYKKLI